MVMMTRMTAWGMLIWKKLDNEDPDAAYKNFSYPTERMIGFNLTLKL